ncbi:hypothetical protein H696_00292 [Fonticula alba]|uniref:Uncharacterized protein n=1 Tax=Fonticula alba TaxID=691883 RepID=A0A058ZEB6_FONAL|nr:hypothetical protein H696_00292 [Fonticula alba]KCV72714.1 hypothetical protein H696_00292 [Fonticula alba]|eukprot:XP_009492415.1 hypothetical protein H696_00292 [Fonticula alba]
MAADEADIAAHRHLLEQLILSLGSPQSVFSSSAAPQPDTLIRAEGHFCRILNQEIARGRGLLLRLQEYFLPGSAGWSIPPLPGAGGLSSDLDAPIEPSAVVPATLKPFLSVAAAAAASAAAENSPLHAWVQRLHQQQPLSPLSCWLLGFDRQRCPDTEGLAPREEGLEGLTCRHCGALAVVPSVRPASDTRMADILASTRCQLRVRSRHVDRLRQVHLSTCPSREHSADLQGVEDLVSLLFFVSALFWRVAEGRACLASPTRRPASSDFGWIATRGLPGLLSSAADRRPPICDDPQATRLSDYLGLHMSRQPSACLGSDGDDMPPPVHSQTFLCVLCCQVRGKWLFSGRSIPPAARSAAGGEDHTKGTSEPQRLFDSHLRPASGVERVGQLAIQARLARIDDDPAATKPARPVDHGPWLPFGWAVPERDATSSLPGILPFDTDSILYGGSRNTGKVTAGKATTVALPSRRQRQSLTRYRQAALSLPDFDPVFSHAPGCPLRLPALHTFAALSADVVVDARIDRSALPLGEGGLLLRDLTFQPAEATGELPANELLTLVSEMQTARTGGGV